MARFELKLPDIGEGVHEGEIAAWHVAAGDRVAEDDPIVDVMTDKASVTIGAPRAGTIGTLRFDVGATAHVGDVLVEIETEDAAAVARPSSPATAVGDIREALPGTEGFGGGAPAALPRSGNGNGHGRGRGGRTSARPASATPSRVAALDASMSVDYFCAKPLATPATRKLARELDVDLRRVPPTGKDGRDTKDDV
jgi:pyruvate dehydrogenase E2 component (dihydrolipoamide acetyltransferase)